MIRIIYNFKLIHKWLYLLWILRCYLGVFFKGSKDPYTIQPNRVFGGGCSYGVRRYWGVYFSLWWSWVWHPWFARRNTQSSSTPQREQYKYKRILVCKRTLKNTLDQSRTLGHIPSLAPLKEIKYAESYKLLSSIFFFLSSARSPYQNRTLSLFDRPPRLKRRRDKLAIDRENWFWFSYQDTQNFTTNTTFGTNDDRCKGYIFSFERSNTLTHTIRFSCEETNSYYYWHNTSIQAIKC